MNPIRTRVHRSLLRPMLVLGGERELVIASGMMTAILVLAFADFVLAALGITFWIVVLAILQRMGRYDPQLSQVYRRHVNRRIYYPAQAHMWTVEPQIKKQQ